MPMYMHMSCYLLLVPVCERFRIFWEERQETREKTAIMTSASIDAGSLALIQVRPRHAISLARSISLTPPHALARSPALARPRSRSPPAGRSCSNWSTRSGGPSRWRPRK